MIEYDINLFDISAKLTRSLHKTKHGPHMLAILINFSLDELDATFVAMGFIMNQSENLVSAILIHKTHLFKKLNPLLSLKVLITL